MFYIFLGQVCEFGGDDCVKTPSLVDRMAHKYSDRLVNRVETVYNQLKVPCNLLDLPPTPTRPQVERKKMPLVKAALNMAGQPQPEPDDVGAVVVKPINGAQNSMYELNKY